jgi:hypothetical protein
MLSMAKSYFRIDLNARIPGVVFGPVQTTNGSGTVPS